MQDPYYLPPHLSTPFTKDEMDAYVSVYRVHDEADGDADGFIEVECVDELMKAAGENPTNAKREELIKECDPNGTGNLGFLDVLRVLARFRFRRDPFGGNRSITNDIPLPLRIETEYDKPCIQHPDRRAQLDDPSDPTVTVMKMLFSRHDADNSGEIEMNEVVDIFAENGLTFDEDELEIIFHKFDVDKSGTLDFTEFTEMMSDLKAEKAIVEKRGANYELPPSLADHFTNDQLAELKVHFGMFDADGGGSIAAFELKAVLDDLGLNPTDDQVRQVIDEVDKDRSGEIEFVEFVDLMHRVNTGDVALGVLAQAVLDSAAGQRLSKEVAELLKAKQLQDEKDNEDDDDDEDEKEKERKLKVKQILNDQKKEENNNEEIEEEEVDPYYVKGLVSLTIDKKEPTKCHVILEGPEDTPYEDRALSLEIVVVDDYPFAAPHAKFTHRLMHVNFSMGLDGTTSMPQLLQYWDAEWDLAKLLNYIMELLIEPNLSLLPSDYADGTRHDPKNNSLASHSYESIEEEYDEGGGEGAKSHHGEGEFKDHNDDEKEVLEEGDGKDYKGDDGDDGHYQDYDHYEEGGYNDDENGEGGYGYYESMSVIQGSPAVDLRRKKGQNRFLAEAVYLFCEQREKYDEIARDFALKYAGELPSDFY